MIEDYPKYFQKSLFFLYPLLNIRGWDIRVPKNSYLIIEDYITEKDYKLICHFEKTEGFGIFEIKYLFKNSFFLEDLSDQSTDDGVYVFDLSFFKKEIDIFLSGKYSKMSEMIKYKIVGFYSEKSDIRDYVESFLYPDKYYEEYSKILKVPISALEEVGELADIYNRDKETCRIKIKNLEIKTSL